MKYFFYDKSFEENKDMFRFLAKRYHPDKLSGNEDMMKQINDEWNVYVKEYNKPYCQKEVRKFSFYVPTTEPEEEQKEDGIMYMGQMYTGTEIEIIKKIALKYGGLTMKEFVESKLWQDYMNR